MGLLQNGADAACVLPIRRRLSEGVHQAFDDADACLGRYS